MAIDNTPPRLRLIATIAAIVVITLVSLDVVFTSYFAFMTDQAKHEKIAPKKDLLAQLAAEQGALAGAKVPIDRAMNQVAKGMRPELIEPKPSDDMAPMTGWSKMPKQPPVAVPHTEDLRPLTAGDAGALTAGDAGAPTVDGGMAPHTTMDAGAPNVPAAVKDAGAQPPAHDH
jgi:hypothetical protein